MGLDKQTEKAEEAQEAHAEVGHEVEEEEGEVDLGGVAGATLELVLAKVKLMSSASVEYINIDLICILPRNERVYKRKPVQAIVRRKSDSECFKPKFQ